MFSQALNQAGCSENDSTQKSVENDSMQESFKPFDARYVAALAPELQAKIFDYIYPWSEGLTVPLIEAKQPEYSFYQDKLSFFRNVWAQRIAINAAKFVVMDEPDKAVEIIQKHPSIVYEQVEVVDEEGRRMRGDILTIAAMMDAFNPFEMPAGKDYGAFEKIAALCPSRHVEKVGKFVNSPEWDAATHRKMEPVRIAFKTFMEKVINAQETAFDKVMAELAPAIEEFKQSLKPIPKEVITAGKVFDMQVIADAFQHLIDKDRDLGYLNDKRDAFCVVVGGLLQDQASKFDKRFVKNGIGYTVDGDYRRFPNRATCNVNKHSFEGDSYSASALGSSFLYGLYGDRGYTMQLVQQRQYSVTGLEREGGPMRLGWRVNTYVKKKTIARKNFCCCKASNRIGAARIIRNKK